MPTYDPQARNAQRYPRVTSREEMDTMPRLPFNTGIGTAIFLSTEKDDARHFRQGICYQEPGHLPYPWDQTNFDETHYVIVGKIRLRCEDGSGRIVYLEAAAGEHIFCPAGFKYTLETSGVYTEFFWTSSPSPSYGLIEIPEYSAALRAMRK